MGSVEAKQGNRFQDDFEIMWKALGKHAWIYRFADAAQNYGRNKRLVATDEQPADFLCAHQGFLGLVECKSTRDQEGFKRSLVRRSQFKGAVESRLSRTPYFFAVRNENTHQVFLIPAAMVLNQAVLTWDSLKHLEWKGDAACLSNILT